MKTKKKQANKQTNKLSQYYHIGEEEREKKRKIEKKREGERGFQHKT